MEGKFLPIGSVVRLKDGQKKINDNRIFTNGTR